MAAVKTKLGRIPCRGLNCGHTVVVKQNEAGTITFACEECDLSSFAKRGTKAYTEVMALLQPAPDARPTGAPPGGDPKAPVPTPPAPPKKVTPFDLQGL